MGFSIKKKLIGERKIMKESCLKRYLEIDEAYPNHLILFRVREKYMEYKALFLDAEVISETLGTKLTSIQRKNKRPIHCIILKSALVMRHVDALTDANFKVIVVIDPLHEGIEKANIEIYRKTDFEPATFRFSTQNQSA